MTQKQSNYVTRRFHDPIDDALDRPIAFNPVFKRMTGSTVAALFLSQAWYWTKRTSDENGWFYKTQAEWEEETGLTRSEQETARKVLKTLGLLEEDLKGVPAQMYYRVEKSVIYDKIGIPQFAETLQTSMLESGTQDCDIPANINRNAETTTETTTIGGLTEKEHKQANDKVTAIIEGSLRPSYQNRDKIPEVYLNYCDLYVRLTGQQPTKRVLNDWLMTFSEWQAEGLSVENIEDAYRYAVRPEGGFLVARPGSLTNTAVAMKTKAHVEPTRPEYQPVPHEDNSVPMPEHVKQELERLKRAS
jgi:hypothetical protein